MPAKIKLDKQVEIWYPMREVRETRWFMRDLVDKYRVAREGASRKDVLDRKVEVISFAVRVLGRLALRGPGAYLGHEERVKLNQALFSCLEVLNDEKGDE